MNQGCQILKMKIRFISSIYFIRDSESGEMRGRERERNREREKERKKERKRERKRHKEKELDTCKARVAQLVKY